MYIERTKCAVDGTKRVYNMNTETKTIKTAMLRNGIETRKALSEELGMKDQLMRDRFLNPSGIRLYELRSLIESLRLTDAEILTIVKGKEVSV